VYKITVWQTPGVRETRIDETVVLVVQSSCGEELVDRGRGLVSVGVGCWSMVELILGGRKLILDG